MAFVRGVHAREVSCIFFFLSLCYSSLSLACHRPLASVSGFGFRSGPPTVRFQYRVLPRCLLGCYGTPPERSRYTHELGGDVGATTRWLQRARWVARCDVGR
jgi:hypothetical protein